MTNSEDNKIKPDESKQILPTPPKPPANIQEIIDKGNKIYTGLKNVLEPSQNGKYVVIEVNSGKHFVGNTTDEATALAKKEFPNQIMFIRRIGQVEKSSRYSLNLNPFYH